MTVPNEINHSGPYTANGVTTAFDYDFLVVNAAHIKVLRTILGVDTPVSDTEYDVTGVGDDAGGQVIFHTAPADGAISMVLNVPFTQEIDLENQGPYFAETVERGFDLGVMRDKQLAEAVGRSIKLPVGGADLTVTPAAGKYWRWNGTGTALEFVDVVNVGELSVSAFMEGVLNNQNASELLSSAGFSTFSKTLVPLAAATNWRTNLSVYSKAEVDAIQAAIETANADVKRGIPAVFASLATFGLDSLHSCGAPLNAVHNIDIEAIWDEKYGASLSGGQDLCVDWTNGNDTTGNGTYGNPYKTVKKAMADAGGTRRIYMLGSTSDEPPNWTAADGVLGTGAARAIKIIALTPGFVFRNPYESLATFTWAASGSGYTATPVTTSRRLHVVQYKTLDLQYFASTAAVDTAGYGWTQNDTTGQIYINLGGLNVNSLKTDLVGIWAGSAARISGACLYIKNCTFWGITDFQLLYSKPGAVWNRPIVFMENCKVQYGSGSYNLGLLGYGIENMGGIIVSKNCEFSYNTLDGVNANPDALAGVGQEPWHVSIDDKLFSNGHTQSRAFVEFITANPGARNCQGISYHQGLIAQINSLLYDNYGQNIAHTQSTPTGGAWLIGVKAGSPRAELQAPQSTLVTPFPKTSAIASRFNNIELYSANSWVDTCAAGGRDSLYGLSLVNGGKVFNGKFDGFTGAVSGTAAAYDPASPG